MSCFLHWNWNNDIVIAHGGVNQEASNHNKKQQSAILVPLKSLAQFIREDFTYVSTHIVRRTTLIWRALASIRDSSHAWLLKLMLQKIVCYTSITLSLLPLMKQWIHGIVIFILQVTRLNWCYMSLNASKIMDKVIVLFNSFSKILTNRH